jgi:hypothetical protein
MKKLIVTAVGVIATVGMLATPATAQSKGDRASKVQGSGGGCRPESMDACVKRQMGLRDAVSGISIQRGDAERFCNRRSQRC